MPNPSSVDVPYIHAKSIVVDRKKSYVGSINFSINSLNKAREVGIIFLNALASVKIIEKFDNDWKVAINIPDKPDLAMCQ
jgi:phosphatidylserine/phosphatidylglycerophosphate/cardiolipin synthase-like enzyme